MIKEALEVLAQEPKDEDEDDIPDGNDYDEVLYVSNLIHTYQLGAGGGGEATVPQYFLKALNGSVLYWYILGYGPTYEYVLYYLRMKRRMKWRLER